jgi:hypothetical protein
VKHEHYLPSKVGTYLRRLQAEYSHSSRAVLAELIASARIFVVEETDYDNWNGGTFGHDVKLFLPMEVLGKVRIRDQNAVCEEIQKDLNACAAAIENEHIRVVSLELVDENDPEYQRAVPVGQRPQLNPDTLSIWKPGQIRLFVSHRDIHKAAARSLGDALGGFGISAFVAHDTIEPMTTWQNEIVKGLETMEIMLAFVTNDFHESVWTNQEIGYALGRNVPIISLKVEQKDPGGFIGNVQALRGRLESPIASVSDIYKLICQKLGTKKRLQQALVLAFIQSPDFSEAKARFDRLAAAVESLSDDEVAQITSGFKINDQLHNASYLTSRYERLRRFLEQATSKKFQIAGRNIVSTTDVEDVIPF